MVSRYLHGNTRFSFTKHLFAKGFDEEGAGQLKGKLVGTTKWIGTAGEHQLIVLHCAPDVSAELYVAFTCRGIP